MSLWVQNVTDGDVSDDQLHQYRLMLNKTELCRFDHIHEHGAAECLRAAAEALDAAEGFTVSPIKRQLMKQKRKKLIAEKCDD